MEQQISQYYITQEPMITDLHLSVNPVSAGAPFTLTIQITQSPWYLYPETYFAAELQAGEVNG